MIDDLRRKAIEFRALHRPPPILLLPNAWDVVSARLFEIEGFRAIGTTSAGIATTLGYPDGQRMSLAENLSVVRRIAGAVRVPVSADIEAGYAGSPEGVAESVRAALAAGAVGINLEDGTGDPADPLFDAELMVERIRAVREAVESEGIPLFLNARVDTYLVLKGGAEGTFRETVARARAYVEAGADGIFVPSMPGGLDRAAIAALAKEIPAPLNLIAGPDMPPVGELERLGVARLSFGPRPMRAALAFVRTMAKEWAEKGTYSLMTADSLSYEEVNEILAGR